MPKGPRFAKSRPTPALGDPDVRLEGHPIRGFQIVVRAFGEYRIPFVRVRTPASLSDAELLWVLGVLKREASTRANVRLEALAARMD